MTIHYPIRPAAGQWSGGAEPALARSALADVATEARRTTTLDWLAERNRRQPMTVERVDLDDLEGWATDPATGTIHHESGRFFSIEGIEVRVENGAVSRWRQPIIDQPEVGVLGILTRTDDGVARFLLQAKAEPGNPGGHQLSPTVQATRSNYTRVHKGRSVPYLEHFLERGRHRVVADVRQSEQGAWFRRKRNRNMVVEVGPEVEEQDGFRWFTLAEIHHLLAVENVVNMDSRTVLSCLALGTDAVPALGRFAAAFQASVARIDGVNEMTAVLSAVTEARTSIEVSTSPVPLNETTGWHRRDGLIRHESGAFFEIVGVAVRASGREVDGWSQPMFAARGEGLAAFLVHEKQGVLHVLLQLRAEPGLVDTVELAPSVQCTPATVRSLRDLPAPPFFDVVEGASAPDIRFDCVMSEEGGRFLGTETRYVIVEADVPAVPPGYLWVTVGQLQELLRHSHYLNVQARSLFACLQSLSTPSARGES
ncbi:NDP-hexose 2,3-dehydratase family protein [Amycolatopsis sp. NPDC049868]|uniref:NDP-hexose 2,3-dehydratase family protein n=1 Tax=Amycolatopsis sp. NPDC049868 TaxID=3363934 RepID=UPI00378D8163